MLVETVTTVDAQYSFVDAMRPEPVRATQNRHAVSAAFSMNDLTKIADALLAEPIKADVAQGKISIIDAVKMQTNINQRLETSRRDIAQGKGIVVNDAYFDGLRARVKVPMSQ